MTAAMHRPAPSEGMDWQAWLGPAWEEITPSQLARLEAAWTAIERRYPAADSMSSRDYALSGALAVIVGADDTERLADAWKIARVAEREAMEWLTGALIADERGESALARAARISRPSIRLARGK